MNYYIQGDAAKAQQIKAAFKKLGYDVKGWLFTSGVYYTLNCKIVNTNFASNEYKLVLNNPDYKELELPKPHYDISNFKPFDKVLVRCRDGWNWECNLFSRYDHRLQNPFITCNSSYPQCIPFENNEHLLGTTDMPSEEYINW